MPEGKGVMADGVWKEVLDCAVRALPGSRFSCAVEELSDVGGVGRDDGRGRCWTTRSERCGVHRVSAPVRNYLMSAGLEKMVVERFCSFLVLRFCWWGWVLKDSGRDGWLGCGEVGRDCREEISGNAGRNPQRP
jgi:hypothetical protein